MGQSWNWPPKAAAVLLACLSGCGGGGGGGPSSPPTSPSPPPAVSTVPLALTPANAEDAATLSQGLAHMALAVAHQAIGFLDSFTEASITSAMPCRGGGSYTTAWQDRNANGRLDAGDRLEWRLTNCWLESLEDHFQGSLALELLSRDQGETRWGGRIEFGSDFYTGDTSGNYHLDGRLQFSQTASRLARDLKVEIPTGSDWRVRLSLPGSSQSVSVDRVTQLVANWTSRRDNGRNSVAVTQMTLQSEILKGRVELRTVQPWSSWMDAQPDEGESAVSGAGSQQLRISLGEKLPFLQLRLRIR